MTRKYITIDNEWYGFRSHTIDDPETRKEIIETFYEFWQNEWIETLKRYYTLRYIMETWNVTFQPV